MRTVGTLVFCLVLSGAVWAQGPKKAWSEDERLIHDYVLTMDKLKRFEKAAKQMSALPSFKDSGDDDAVTSGDKTISESARAFSAKCPQCVAVLAANGFTPKEYMTFTMTLFAASMSAWSKEQGGKVADFVNPANITFVQQHKAELEAMNPKKPQQDESGQSSDEPSEDSQE